MEATPLDDQQEHNRFGSRVSIAKGARRRFG